MVDTVQLPPLKTRALFSTPVWQSRVPELFRRHAEMKQAILADWEQGRFERDRHGYGYQSAANLFYPENKARFPYCQVLEQAFRQNVVEILRQRHGLANVLSIRISAVLGWVLVQTNEDWVNGTWHDHYPATISACYYLQVPDTEHEHEGALGFQRGAPQDMFVEQIQRIKPREGDFILFPSSLMHRPEPCPSAQGLRITLAMDAYIDWLHPQPDTAATTSG